MRRHLVSLLSVALDPPRIGVLSGPGVSSTSLGNAWYLLEQRLGVPFDDLPAREVSTGTLEPYDVLYVPSSHDPDDALGEDGRSSRPVQKRTAKRRSRAGRGRSWLSCLCGRSGARAPGWRRHCDIPALSGPSPCFTTPCSPGTGLAPLRAGGRRPAVSIRIGGPDRGDR